MMTGTFGRSAFTLGSISRPVIPGMLISDKININDGPGIAFTCSKAADADRANSMMKRPDRKSRRNCCRNISSTSGSSSTTTMYVLIRSSAHSGSGLMAGQGDHELGEYTKLGIDLDPAAVLLHDDIVRHRETK